MTLGEGERPFAEGRSPSPSPFVLPCMTASGMERADSPVLAFGAYRVNDGLS